MSYHIVSIDSPNCSLSCRDGQLTCRTDEGEKRLPLEDVASIIITSFSAQIHSHLFLEAAKHGVSLIICEAFKPVSLVLPANRSTDTLLTRAQVDLPAKSKQRLWQITVDAKCANQSSLARELDPEPARREILDALDRMAKGRNPHKEAACARHYWQLWSAALLPPSDTFTRERGGGGLNHLLNYGYAVLLSTMLQKLFAIGLDPTFGIHHAPRERSTPLAYDLMEPFRPCVDWRVAQWVRDRPERIGEGVTKDFRQWVTAFPLEKIEHLGFTIDVRSCVEAVVRSFRKALMQNQARLYKPWTPKNSKWAGSSLPSICPS